MNNLIKDFQHECKRYEKEEAFCNNASILLNKYMDIFSQLEIKKVSLQFTADLSMIFIIEAKPIKLYIEQYFDTSIDKFEDKICIIRSDKKGICFYGLTKIESLKNELKEIL